MRIVTLLLAFLTTFSAFSTVTFRTKECPQAFVGHVKEIISPVGPSSAFSTQKVVFENSKTLKGNIDEQVILDVLENGPFQVVAGEDYRIQTRNGKLCWIEKL